MDAFRRHDLRDTDVTWHREAGTPTHEPRQLTVIANALGPTAGAAAFFLFL